MISTCLFVDSCLPVTHRVQQSTLEGALEAFRRRNATGQHVRSPGLAFEIVERNFESTNSTGNVFAPRDTSKFRTTYKNCMKGACQIGIRGFPGPVELIEAVAPDNLSYDPLRSLDRIWSKLHT